MDRLGRVVEAMRTYYAVGGADWGFVDRAPDQRVTEDLGSYEKAFAEAEKMNARAAIAACDEWQPIETAPKDRPVLVWWPYWSAHPVVAQYNEAVGSWWGHEQLADDGEEPKGWQPLPNLPEEG